MADTFAKARSPLREMFARLTGTRSASGVDNRTSAARDRAAATTIAVVPRAFAELPARERLKWLGWILAGLGLLALVIGIWMLRSIAAGAAAISAATQMQTLSQRIAKSSQQVLVGAPEAANELAESRTQFDQLAAALAAGGAVGSLAVPATTGAPLGPLDAVRVLWKTTSANAETVLKYRQNLTEISRSVRLINDRNPELLDIAEQIVALKLQTNSGVRELSLSGQLVMLTQRMAKNANALLAADILDPESSFELQRDAQTFRQGVSAMLNGSDSPRIAPTRDPETQEKLRELDTNFRGFQAAVATIINNLQSLIGAKDAARALVADSGRLLTATGVLAQAYQTQLAGRRWAYLLLGLVILAALATVLLMARAFREDSERRAVEAAQQADEAARQNRQNQEAILRLMNEMSAVADGDLTVRATVTEDITGAIADSVNYTVEELRALVGRINGAAEEVAKATRNTRANSDRLLAEADTQSRQIQDASSAVLRMARAITDVSTNATRSVTVARQSLSAAEQGAAAAQNSIAGMNEIRGQIQETSKRIKRLGESSQQIGEIVEIISDITERTQVLALNAAIQAASAGEAGRGFTVVAEEVQRLAERSAESTRQIAGLVKTIQSDTYDAVGAMERSTQGVVEGARLSDGAGQALTQIGEVSTRLANLIEEIASTAQHQANAAGAVAGSMQEILAINKQTSEGTRATAHSVDQLSELAAQLRASVANFRI